MASFSHSNHRAHNRLFYQLMQDKLLAWNPQIRGALYDLGCGELPYKSLFTNVTNYMGVDWSSTPHLLKADVVADLNKPLPIPDAAADHVLSISVLEHLIEPQQMLSEAFRILKPGGTLHMQTPFQWMVHEAPYDYFRYTPYALQHLLSKAGFVDIEVTAMAGFFATRALKFNYFSSRILGAKSYAVRGFFYVALQPVWWLTQTLAPLLDRLFDSHWETEALGYWTTARKPD